MSLGASLSEYQFSPLQSNALSAPQFGQNFGDITQVFTRENASTNAKWGGNTRESQQFDSASYYMFNPTLHQGVDCGRVNTAAGRPNLTSIDAVGGSACYNASISSEAAAKSLDPAYNSYAPSAVQVILAEGDVRYAPSRFADQMNYLSPSLSDNTFQPRLMGTRDTVGSGCYSTQIDQTVGNSTSCALRDDPLPYLSSSDPRTAYGVDEPHSQYWAAMNLGGVQPQGCEQISNDYQYHTSMCATQSVEGGMPPKYIPQYGPVGPDSRPQRFARR